MISGTPMYMAPEQVLGQTLDHRADLFSLGSVLYELATGRPPFRAANTIAVLRRVADDTPRPMQEIIPEIPDWLVAIVTKLHAKKPEDRFQSAKEVADLLARCQSELQLTGKVTSVQSSPHAPREDSRTSTDADRANDIAPPTTSPARSANFTQSVKATLDHIQRESPNPAASADRKSPGPGRLWWRNFGAGLIVAVVLFAAFLLNRSQNNETANLAIREPSAPGQAESIDSTNPDRRAAEWVLSIGGTIKIKENGQERQSGAAGDLPNGPFELTVVNLISNPKVSDAGLAHFKDCKNLTILYLFGTNVSDAGLAHFRNCKNLQLLGLNGAKNVTDTGMAHFKDCKNITTLDLRGTAVSDAGLVHFQDRKNYTFLYFGNTKVSDAGLAHFKDCKNLTSLSLNATKVSDAGLAHLKDCKNLVFLHLDHTQVSDAGLERLAEFPNLNHLVITETKVTEAGVKKLSAALPGCKIEWDGGVIEPRPTDPDRRAAEWVLSVGGTVDITENSPVRRIGAVGDLPRGAFELTTVFVESKQNVSDAGLAHLKDCKNLTGLSLNSTQVSDAGLANFKGRKNFTILQLRSQQVSDAGLANFQDCKNLTELSLQDTRVTDAGLAHFKDCQNLTTLALITAKVSDAGLANFQDCKNLTHLNLSDNQVSDAGLEHFKDCKNLTSLSLADTQVSDAGLALFKDCKNLTYLILYRTQIGDAGLVHFKDCKNLSTLHLFHTQVSDAGLERLADFPNLNHLVITETNVTEAGVKKLSAALPGCKIEWDGGVIEPTVSPDRRAAKYVLSIVGGVRITENGQEREIKAVVELPRGAFELTFVDLRQNPKVSDAGLAYFKDCKNLTTLDLFGTNVSDAGLAHFKECKNLTEISLENTSVTDAGLAHFQDCKNLTLLNLATTNVSDAGLSHFHECKNLTYLNLTYTSVSDAGLVHFKECKNLIMLFLPGTRVSDVGLAHFRDCKNLTQLNLTSTLVSDTGLAHFQDCKKLTDLRLADTQVSDAGLDVLAGLPSLTGLQLVNTRISLRGHERLKTAMPKCQIIWSEANRSVAESVLALGGTVEIGSRDKSESRPIQFASELPAVYFHVRRVSLVGVTKPLDKLSDLFSVLRFPEFDRLESLDLSGIPLPEGYHYGYLAPIHGLRDLSLGYPMLTDQNSHSLKLLKQVKRLSLAGSSSLTDAGIKHLVGLTNLESLDLRRTKATAAGIDELKATLPGCKIEWDGGVIEGGQK